MHRRSLLLSAVLVTGFAGTSVAGAEELQVGISVAPSSMDPQLGALGSDETYYRHLYDALTLRNANLQVEPGLATGWELLDDNIWELKLREDVTFSDGSAFDAEDVVFTLDRLPTVPGNDGLNIEKMSSVERVEVVDPHTIRLHTSKPTPEMPTLLSFIYILSDGIAKDATTEQFNTGEAAVGTGPYTLDRWDRGQAVHLKARPDYWGQKSAFETVSLREMTNPSARVAAMLAGDVDIIDGVPPLDVERLEGTQGIEVEQAASGRVIFIQTNNKVDGQPLVTDAQGQPLGKNPFKDARVRQAVQHAISRDLIVDKIMDGHAVPTDQGVPQGFFGYAEGLQPTPYDAAVAKKLLAEAGYPDGFGVTLACPNDRYVNDAKICQAVGQMLTQVGHPGQRRYHAQGDLLQTHAERGIPDLDARLGQQPGHVGLAAAKRRRQQGPDERVRQLERRLQQQGGRRLHRRGDRGDGRGEAP